MRHLAYVVPVLLALWYFDGVASRDATVGWERNGVFDARKRARRSRARHIVLLGSSTSVDWLRPRQIAPMFGVGRGHVLDAHINGCHQACTFAEVKRLLQQRRHFRYAFYGTNQFQLCEFEHTKRVLQVAMNLPTEDVPEMFGLYMHAQRPLNYIARFFAIKVSGMYGDTNYLQAQWARGAFGNRRGRKWRWARKKGPKRAPWHLCPYEPKQIAYKAAVMGALVDALGKLADKVFIMLLPDINLSERDPERAAKVRAAWKKHRALFRRIVGARRFAHLIDLAQPSGARAPSHFGDGFHTSPRGRMLQRRLFHKLMRDGKHLPNNSKGRRGARR